VWGKDTIQFFWGGMFLGVEPREATMRPLRRRLGTSVSNATGTLLSHCLLILENLGFDVTALVAALALAVLPWHWLRKIFWEIFLHPSRLCWINLCGGRHDFVEAFRAQSKR